MRQAETEKKRENPEFWRGIMYCAKKVFDFLQKMYCDRDGDTPCQSRQGEHSSRERRDIKRAGRGAETDGRNADRSMFCHGDEMGLVWGSLLTLFHLRGEARTVVKERGRETGITTQPAGEKRRNKGRKRRREQRYDAGEGHAATLADQDGLTAIMTRNSESCNRVIDACERTRGFCPDHFTLKPSEYLAAQRRAREEF